MNDATPEYEVPSTLNPKMDGACGVLTRGARVPAHSGSHADWLIDNAETYDRLLHALHRAHRSIRIAQLAFDSDCVAYASESSADSLPHDATIAGALVERAVSGLSGIQILLNATWLLDTARPLRRAFAKRGIPSNRIEVRGFSRFPHFMHAKLVLVDGREAFLLGSPFVNSYWDDLRHAPIDVRRPLRELGGRPLHDVSIHLRGPVVNDLEAMFASVWRSAAPRNGVVHSGAAHAPAKPRTRRDAGMRIVCDAPDGILPGSKDGSMAMLAELLDGIARARSFIYVEHQYLTSRPIVAALAAALVRAPALEIIIVINQNPDLTAYRGWQNVRLAEHGLLAHPRVGVFTLWSTDQHPERAHVTRINQLFIHSKVIVVDDEWAAVGTSNLDGVSMGDYGDDFSGVLGRRVFRSVRNVEVNVVIDASDATEGRAESILALRERLWYEHLGLSRAQLRELPRGGWLNAWRAAAKKNVRMLSGCGKAEESARARRMTGHVLPYSVRGYPREQLADLGIPLSPDGLVLCYNPGWLVVHASPHWIRNIF